MLDMKENQSYQRLSAVPTENTKAGMLRPACAQSNTKARTLSQPPVPPRSASTHGASRKARHAFQHTVDSKVNSSKQASSSEVADIDLPHKGSVTLVPAYAQANSEFMREQEEKYRPRCDYVPLVQRKITRHMRQLLVDWLIDVAEDFRLVTESLYLTVTYLDRFLSAVPIQPSQLQLLGVGCMCIATKFEEIYPPPIEKLSDITANNCGVDGILNAEHHILRVLGFHVATPTAKVFMQRFLRAAVDATTVEYMYLEQHSRYILELTLLDYECLQYRPSTLAAAAILLSRSILSGKTSRFHGQWYPHVIWNKTMQHYTFHSAAQLKPCAEHICQIVSKDQKSSNSAVFRKYKVEKRKSVALIPCPETLDARIFQANYAAPVPSDWITVTKF